MTKANIGVVGMAVMGKNLALNIERNGYTVALYNRTASRTFSVVEENPGKKLVPTETLEEFVASIEKPRRIILMVKAGFATDATIQALLPLLDKGDTLVDGGNTFFKETIRRHEELKESGIHFIGTGVSGGEEGALYGPAIMPGGPKDAYELIAPVLEKIAAKAEDGQACVTYIGPDGAGHYVKMVHNGIEYGDMQLIAEAYDLLKRLLGLSNEEIAEIFEEWKTTELNSYLIDITAHILKQKDPLSGEPIVDKILDRAGNKGTGKWTSQQALDLGTPLPLITESVFARFLSAQKSERLKGAAAYRSIEVEGKQLNKDEWIEKIRQALYFSKIMSYAQGFAQMQEASQHFNWDLKLGEIAKIFRAGCIIRAQFLQRITDAFEKQADLSNLLLDDYFKAQVSASHQAIRDLVAASVQAGLPCPCFSSAIAYFDGYRSENLPANLIQAQRDCFGAHTYERTDRKGHYHFYWDKGTEEKISED
ncbi:NADP-dependent phosphogluconate dehydrogenase [Atopobacter sp. AH10]|uniref:NADP-dependent phosphogluconate dehydrogenase n=1 Tax=Atopobacter sp. AH10 TaxID=2315861 RepID=UPI000EF26C64|nr:NADP-dependent phosphogluconate dehydrogenase [Atopobacter sp. AH10]RLK63243.1 NADP-dependent phosphogluconate dehydrogenase [Atopobacter sp. AH10]